ncbi:MAG: sugar ABC transporter substrate-binding protein [Syntrophaceae bacterium]|nr:sugar ABC transporter substrate-binding protein [Syntrophaceae bacterium]
MKKILFVVLLLINGSILFAAGEKEGVKTSEPVEVRMWTFLDPSGEGLKGRDLALKKILDNWQKENPGIKMAVEPQQWSTMTAKFLAAHHTGNAPDIQWVRSQELGEALKQNALADLESLFLKDWPASEIEDVSGAYFDIGVRDGKHYQITHSRNCQSILFYRGDLVKDKGIAMNFRTWDEFLDVGKKLTEQDAKLGIQRWGLGQGYSTGATNPPLAVPVILYTQDLFTKDGQANWTTPDAVKAFELMRDMIRVHKITPESAVNYSVEDLYQGMAAGQYGMIVGGATRVQKVRSDASAFEPNMLQIRPLPSWDGKGYSPVPLAGWFVGVWSKSKVKTEAGKFLEFMSNRESDKLWVLDGGQVPVRKSTVKALGSFFEKPESAYLSVMADAMDKGWVLPTEYTITGFQDDLNAAIQQILVEKVGVLDALKKAAEAFNDRNK